MGASNELMDSRSGVWYRFYEEMGVGQGRSIVDYEEVTAR